MTGNGTSNSSVSGGSSTTSTSSGGSSSGETTTTGSTDTLSTSSTSSTSSTGATDTDGTTDTEGTTDTDDTEGFVPHTYECVPVGDSYNDGFFALREFKDQLYAGVFGYGDEDKSMVYRFAPWELTSPGLLGVGESICALLEWEGYLYANTENSGFIARTADGLNWETVYDGTSGAIGCGLAASGDALYAVSYNYGTHQDAKILRTTNGADWDVVWSGGQNSWYIREITFHDGAVHAFYIEEDSNNGFRLTSTNGLDWETHPTPSRFFRATSWKKDLWIGSTNSRSNGVSGVWRVPAGGDLNAPELVHAGEKSYVTELAAWDGRLWAATADGWKDDNGTSTLIAMSDPSGDNWETICEFPEVSAWAVAPAGDNLYVGTWQYGKGGKVYEVRIVE